ncbi:MAG TPA: acyltransferase [Candidatus Eisenbacteria bacterium]|nr:acyltransferase [Candidatus Eisenbacteria bacterium]
MAVRQWSRRLWRRLALELGVWILNAQPEVARRTLPRFANRPRHLTIELPRRIVNPQFVWFGDHVWLGPGSFISATTRYPSSSTAHPEQAQTAQTFSPVIRIGDRVTSTGGLIIGAVKRVEIGNDVLLAHNVTILDCSHGYATVDVPYKYQPLERIAPVEIKSGSWIGQNAVLLAGASVGEMSIIGANSVVTSVIPDRCIAVGAPARVIKTWDSHTHRWRTCEGTRAAVRLQ